MASTHLALSQAEQRTRDKADGAELEDAFDWVSTQLIDTSHYANEAFLAERALVAAQEYATGGTPYEVDAVTIAEDIRNNGLPAEVLAGLAQVGATAEEIQAIEASLASLDSEGPVTLEVDPTLSYKIDLVSRGTSAFEDLKRGIELGVQAGIRTPQEVEQTVLDDIQQTKDTIESMLLSGTPWHVINDAVVEFIAEIRIQALATSNFSAFSEALDFAYGVAIDIGFELAPHVESVAVVAEDLDSAESFVVEFDSLVQIDPSALEVLLVDGSTVVPELTLSEVDGKTAVHVAPPGGAKWPFGRYVLTIDAEGVLAAEGTPLDGDWDFNPGSDYASPLSVVVKPGDYNGDGTVDEVDYGRWKSSFGSLVASSLFADGNHDGSVDLADYTIWRNNLGANVAPATPMPAVVNAELGAVAAISSTSPIIEGEPASDLAYASLPSGKFGTAQPTSHDNSHSASAPSTIDLSLLLPIIMEDDLICPPDVTLILDDDDPDSSPDELLLELVLSEWE